MLRNDWRAWIQLFKSAVLPQGRRGPRRKPGSRLRVESLEQRYAPTANVTNLSPATDTGRFNDDAITNETQPVVVGTANAGDTVEVFDGADSLGTTTADGSGSWMFSISSPLTEGGHDVSASDNEGVGAHLAVTIDIMVPDAPLGLTLDPGSDSGVAGDNTTNVTQPAITGTAEPNSLVTLKEDSTALGTAITNGSGDWSVAPTSPLSEGDHTLTATATDVAGNESALSDSLTVTIDTMAPATPVISSVVDDTGASAADLITSDATPIISGTADANTTITLQLGTTVIDTTTADGSGDWSFDFSAGPPLADGSYTVTATDSVGNESAASVEHVVIDTVGEAPQGLTLDASTDSGVQGDNITNFTELTITGTAEAGSTVELFEGITSQGTTTADGSGAWSTTTSTLPEGDHTFTATATDLAGNVSVASDPLTVTIDLTAPDAPQGLTLDASTDSGVQGDNLTNFTELTITGTAEAGSTVKLFDSSTQVGMAIANGSGDWSITTSTLSEGAHTLTATATDDAGNVSDASDPLTVTIDTMAPATPVISSVLDDTGASAADLITSDATPIISGTADANTTITLQLGTTVIDTTTAGVSGDWSFDFSPGPPLADGSYTVTATDDAGNESAASAEHVVIDIMAPAAPQGLTLDASTDSGVLGDNLTNFTALTITGTAEAGSTVKLFDGTTQVGSGTANGSGNWSITTSTLSTGAHTLTATATDVAGNVSDASGSLTVTIDTTAPAAPQGLTLDASTDSGALGDNLTNFTALTITGTAEAGSTVKLFDGTTQVGSVTLPTGTGTVAWSITTVTLSQGAHTLAATATDTAGNVSSASAALTVTIDTTAPSPPSTPDLTPASDTGRSHTDNITTINTPTFIGTAEAGSTVRIIDGSVVLGTATADSTGFWTFTSPALANGVHTITATATDAAGNTSAVLGALSVTIDTTGRLANPLTNVTNLVRITRTKPRRLRHPVSQPKPPRFHGPFFRQTVTITNTSASPLEGPLFLVLDGLPSGINLVGRTGRTQAQAPLRSQFIMLDVSSLAAGQSVNVVLTFSNPSSKRISYTPRLLAGVGTL